MGEGVAFYLLAALILACGVAVVTVRSAVHSVIFLVACFLLVAMLYVLLSAEFLAVIQVLVYAGGIMVLYLFVVMLVNLKRAPEQRVDPRRRDRLGILLGGAVLAELVAVGLYAFMQPLPASPAAETVAGQNNIERVGWMLYTDFLVPFEVASVLLLVALVGAIVLAKREL